MEKKEFIVILSITFAVIVFWAVADLVFHTDASVPLDPKIDILTEPISEEFDSQTLKQIDQQVTSVTDVQIRPNTEVIPPPLPTEDELESLNMDNLSPTPEPESTVVPIPEIPDQNLPEEQL